jgi:rubredoxin
LTVRVALASTALTVRRWRCLWCGLVYDEAFGLPEAGMAPGTQWADIPDGWMYPDCRAPKADFRMVEMATD